MPTHPAIRDARREADRLRGVAQVYSVLAGSWVVLAMLRWATGDGLWLQVAWTVLAVANVAVAVLHRRRAREAAARLEVLRSEVAV